MPFPESLEGLREAGYVKQPGGSTCGSCGAALEWWLTPNGKKMPMDAGKARSRFARCPGARNHRQRRGHLCTAHKTFAGELVRCGLTAGHTTNHSDGAGHAWAEPEPQPSLF